MKCNSLFCFSVPFSLAGEMVPEVSLEAGNWRIPPATLLRTFARKFSNIDFFSANFTIES